ncbi:MAG: hypothetical protein ABH891_07140 [Candidatus Omnitrophota bacterium]
MKSPKRGGILFLLSLMLTSCAQPIDTKKIDSEITSLNAQVAELQKEKQNYSGGLVLDLLTVREQIYKNTLAMLEQKRQGINKFIKISYSVNGEAIDEAVDSTKEIKRLEEEIAKAKGSISDSQKESAEYSGGLIKVMIDMRIATEQVSLAALEQKRLSLLYKFPIWIPSISGQENNIDKPARKAMSGEAINQV